MVASASSSTGNGTDQTRSHLRSTRRGSSFISSTVCPCLDLKGSVRELPRDGSAARDPAAGIKDFDTSLPPTHPLVAMAAMHKREVKCDLNKSFDRLNVLYSPLNELCSRRVLGHSPVMELRADVVARHVRRSSG